MLLLPNAVFLAWLELRGQELGSQVLTSYFGPLVLIRSLLLNNVEKEQTNKNIALDFQNRIPQK